MDKHPPVSVVMTVVDEERHLHTAVQHVLDQDYPGSLEIVIAVGPSRDHTQQIADELAQQHQLLRIVANPSGKTPAGLNAAIAHSTGAVIVRVDGHAMLPPDYVRTAVEVLERTGADNVGGIMAAQGTTPMERAVAAAMTMWFGVGGASFHIGGEESEALTVYLGCFRRSALERVGGYDESMERAQDWELNHRLRSTGGRIWFTPALSVTYRPRNALRALARQYFNYGRWRREIARRDPSTLSVRYLAAPALVIALAISAAAILAGLIMSLSWLTLLGLVLPVMYLVVTLIVSATASGVSASTRVRLPAVFWVMHVSWGAGFLRGAGKVLG